VSTDDPSAVAIARTLGCEVPFTRPAALSADDTPHLPVMQHAVNWLREHEAYTPQWVMILMPTSPLRQPRHIVESISLARSSGADSVVSVDQVPPHLHPMRMLRTDEQGWARLYVGDRPVRDRPVRRQGLPDAWVFNGAIYLFKAALLSDANPSLYGDRVATYHMAPPSGHNIDDAADWAEAERILSQLA
jgi:CMP-N,N'-diacetyllegionaminic acid synthase